MSEFDAYWRWYWDQQDADDAQEEYCQKRKAYIESVSPVLGVVDEVEVRRGDVTRLSVGDVVNVYTTPEGKKIAKLQRLGVARSPKFQQVRRALR